MKSDDKSMHISWEIRILNHQLAYSWEKNANFILLYVLEGYSFFGDGVTDVGCYYDQEHSYGGISNDVMPPMAVVLITFQNSLSLKQMKMMEHLLS